MRRVAGLLCAVIACGGSAPVAPVTSTPVAPPHEQVAVHGARLPGSRVRMTLPSGFVRASRAPTLVDANRNITLSLVEMTLKGKEADDAMGGFTEAGRQLQSLVTTEIVRDHARGMLMTGLANGTRTSMLVLRDEPAIGMVIVRYTDASAEVAHAILDSVSLDRTATFDPLVFQGLALASTEGLALWDVMAPPAMLKEPDAKPPIPPSSLTIAVSAFPLASAADADANLTDILRQSHVKESTIVRTRSEIDSLPAIEIVAEATKDALPATFYGVIMVEGKGAIIAWAEVVSPEALARTKRVIHGLHRLDGVIGPVDLH